MARFGEHLLRRAFLVFMMAGAALITVASLEYFDFRTLPAFMIEKLPLKFRALWLASLRVHVASALVAFPLCLLLMTRAIQRRRVIHRWVGRVTGVLMLLLLVPTGAVLAFDAKGGAVVTAGFLLSGAILGWFTVRGVISARRGELTAHQRAMRHVVGQMSVAVTSRALMMALDAYGMHPDQAYVVALFVPVLGSAAVAELISWRPRRSLTLPLPSLERISREVSLVPRFVRIRSVVRPVSRVGR